MEWPLFADVDERHVRDVLDIARRRNFGSGEIVFHQGDPADTLHLIRSGRVAVRLDAGRGESVIAAVLGPGEMFGELALLDEDASRSATIAALEPLETLSVHQLDFSRLRREVARGGQRADRRAGRPGAPALASSWGRRCTWRPTGACCGGWWTWPRSTTTARPTAGTSRSR